MRRLGWRLLLSLLMLVIWLHAPVEAAEQVSVVTNVSVNVDEISVSDLKAIFLGMKTSVKNTRLRPVLETGGTTYILFARDYLGKTDNALRIYYRGLVFTGRGEIPAQFDTDEKVIAYVRKTPGAIGYVSAATVAGSTHEGIKTVRVN